MPSLQARALETWLRMRRLFDKSSGVLDVARERADVESMAGMFKPLGPIQCQPVVAGGVPAEWIVPAEVRPGRAILYLHGGSFNSGSITSHRTLAGNVALACKARALLLDYRLAPEHPFPAAIEDVVAACEWLLAQGIDPRQLIVAGDSAGGTLALALCIYRRDQGQPLPAAAVCLSPAPDLNFDSDSWIFNAKKDVMIDERKERTAVEIYLHGADPQAPLASPYYADLHGLPPLLIQVGSSECLLSDCQGFAEKAKAAGVDVTLEVWPGMQHEWQFAANIMPEGRQAIARVGEFVERVIQDFTAETAEDAEGKEV
jgi:monoterpene epsilon-lactone hydrolase